MSWMAKLYETYNKALSDPDLQDYPAPYFHAEEGCHIEITIDGKGNFKSASSLVVEVKYRKKTDYKKTKTIIPITPKSLTGRTSGPAPYPLAEKIQYIAKDYADYGRAKPPYFSYYVSALTKWANHEEHSHWKVRAILKYVTKGTVIKDLVSERQLFITLCSGKPLLITKWKDQAEAESVKPPLIRSVNEGEQGNAIIRWVVQKTGNPNSTTWEDNELIEAWQSYAESMHKENGFCQILGRKAFLTQTHPKAIYPQAAKAKLISMPTNNGYLTYQGRFTDDTQPVGISFEASQKAHNALRWLIERGEGKNQAAAIVSWAISDSVADTPHPMDDLWDLLSTSNEIEEKPAPKIKNNIDNTINFGQSFSIKLTKYMNGYRAKLENASNVVIMGLDSVTDGRMSVIYYQEFFPEDYIDRLSKWHDEFSWYQRHKIDESVVWPDCAPSPKDISEAIYGNIVGDDIKKKLKKNAVERILPCIVEARPFPLDLVLKVVHRVSNRSAYKIKEQWLWEKHLGIACALYRGFCKRDPKQVKEYIVGLEQENNSRHYLYGRLLAIAEQIEEKAISIAKEKKRTTHASRLMQRFSARPAETWLSIEEGINPYQQRLRRNIPPLESAYKKLLDDVCDAFSVSDFTSSDKLSGEYLLGYHCQRKWLKEHRLKDGKWILKNINENDELKLEGEE